MSYIASTRQSISEIVQLIHIPLAWKSDVQISRERITKTMPLDIDKIKAFFACSIETIYPVVITTCPMIKKTGLNSRSA